MSASSRSSRCITNNFLRWHAPAVRCLITAWVGALWTAGLLVAPLVFAILPTQALAGEVVRALFTAVNCLGAVCGVLLLLTARATSGRWLAQTRSRLTAVMFLLTLLNLAVFDPWLDRLRVATGSTSTAFVWAHGVTAGMYLLLCLLGLWLVLLDGGGVMPATE